MAHLRNVGAIRVFSRFCRSNDMHVLVVVPSRFTSSKSAPPSLFHHHPRSSSLAHLLDADIASDTSRHPGHHARPGGPDCVAAYIHWSDSPVPKLLRFVQNHIHHVFASAPSRRPGRLRGRTVLMATGGVVAGRRRQHRHQVEYGKPRGSPIDDSGPGG
jgi:hypothetical protein